MKKVSPRLFFDEVPGIFFEDHKRSEYHVSHIVVFSLLVLSCLKFGNGVDIENMSICDFTAEHFSQLLFREK